MTILEELQPLLEAANTEEADVIRVDGELTIAKQDETTAREALTQAQAVTEEKETSLGTEKSEYKTALTTLRNTIDEKIQAL